MKPITFKLLESSYQPCADEAYRLGAKTSRFTDIGFRVLRNFWTECKPLSVTAPVRPTIVEQWYLWLIDRKLSPVSCFIYATSLRRLEKWMVQKELADQTPFKLAVIPPFFLQKPDEQPTMTDEQYVQLRTYFATYDRDKGGLKPKQWGELVELAWHTALRISDCCNLEQSNIDFAHNMIVIRPVKVKRKRLRIPLRPDLREMFVKRIELTRLDEPEETHVWPDFYRYYRDANVNLPTKLSDHVHRAGLPAGLTFHTLRHTRISKWFQSGVTLPTVMALTGNNITSLAGYMHADDQDKMRAMGIEV